MADGERQDEPFSLSVFRRQHHPVSKRAARRTRDVALAVNANAAACHRQRAKDRLQNFGAPRADKSGDAIDFTRSDVEGYVGEALPRGQVFDLQQRGAEFDVLLWEKTADRSVDHSAHQRLLRPILNRPRLDAVSVTHHGDTVTNFEHLLEVVTDKNDAHTCLLQPCDGRDENAHLVGREGRRRLVENDDARATRERATDLNELALRER